MAQKKNLFSKREKTILHIGYVLCAIMLSHELIHKIYSALEIPSYYQRLFIQKSDEYGTQEQKRRQIFGIIFMTTRTPHWFLAELGILLVTFL